MTANTMDVSSLLQNIVNVSTDFVLRKVGAREQLLNVARKLVSALETPSETVFRMAVAEPINSALVRMAVDLEVFETLKSAKGSPVTVAELSKAGGADPVFVHRMLRHLAAMNVIQEDSLDVFKGTALSDALTEDSLRGGIIYTFDVFGPSARHLPDYMREHEYRNPVDIADGPFQFAHDTSDPFFVWMSGRPRYMTAFNQYMGGYRKGKLSWLDPGLYPIESVLQLDDVAVKENAAVMVDVGGGKGHDLVELKTKHSSIRGRFVLQDQAAVINEISSLPTGIEATAHDFFTPQPEQGAKVYHLHSVLHDWDDESCLKILANIKPAMRRGYSKILINDLVVPDREAGWFITAMDLCMMSLGSVKERTEADWRALINRSGLVVGDIRTFEAGSESIIELSLPETF